MMIDVMADTVSTSFGRSFFVGLFAQPLILPAFGAILVGLALILSGVLLINGMPWRRQQLAPARVP